MRFRLIMLFFCSLIPALRAQDTALVYRYFSDRGEAVLRFHLTDQISVNKISRMVSVDAVAGNEVRAYVNRKEFENFLKLGIPFEVLTPPSLQYPGTFQRRQKNCAGWGTYPSYSEYLEAMQNFTAAYPKMARLDTIGSSVKGKVLLALKISDSVQIEENEPRVFLTSSMHGDEVTGYVLLLHLIDSLLTGYAVSERIRNLVNRLEIYINPLANPDGTYASGDYSVFGSTRSNANHVDLNRNFPDPAEGEHPDGNAWQPETLAMMRFMQAKHFCLSANFHGGAEVVNYPWDTWVTRHPDDAWFRRISLRYADSAQKYGPSGYFTSPYASGITNGYDWYRITGGRQDYTTFFLRGREVTIEISNIKLPDASSLPTYWEANYRSLFGFMEEALRGVHGFITDSLTGKSVYALISIPGLDQAPARSEISSDSLTGYFVRLLAPGDYELFVSAEGYNSRVISLNLPADNLVFLHVRMVPDTSDTILPQRNGEILTRLYPVPASSELYMVFSSVFSGSCNVRISDLQGRLVKSVALEITLPETPYRVSVEEIPPGVYVLEVQCGQRISHRKFIKMKK